MSDPTIRPVALRGELVAARSRHAEYVMPVLFVLLGSLFLWQARDMSQLGAVFPTTIAGVMVLASLLRLLQVCRHRVIDNHDHERGSTLRRVLLVVIMGLWALALQWLGFLLASLLAFVALMLVAQHHRWYAGRLVRHLVTGVVLVGCFYGLFAGLLNVPLPVGQWFGG